MKRMPLSLALGVAALCFALSSSASAATPKAEETTEPIGEVICTDPRIIDVSGEYDLVGGATASSMTLTQDLNGNISGEIEVETADFGSTGPFALTGFVDMTAKDGPRVSLDYGVWTANPGFLQQATDSAIRIRGTEDGGTLSVRVQMRLGPVRTDFLAELDLENQDTGYVMLDEAWLQGKKNKLHSTREVDFPGASVTNIARLKTKNGVMTLDFDDSRAEIDLKGFFEGGVFQVLKHRVEIGHTKLNIPASETEVTTSTFPIEPIP